MSLAEGESLREVRVLLQELVEFTNQAPADLHHQTRNTRDTFTGSRSHHGESYRKCLKASITLRGVEKGPRLGKVASAMNIKEEEMHSLLSFLLGRHPDLHLFVI